MRVQGPRSRVQGSGFRVQVSEFKVQGSGFRVQVSKFGVQGEQRTSSEVRTWCQVATLNLGMSVAFF